MPGFPDSSSLTGHMGASRKTRRRPRAPTRPGQERSGLIVTGENGQLRDHFHDRLMIPLRAGDGVVIAFIGRRHPDAGDLLA